MSNLTSLADRRYDSTRQDEYARQRRGMVRIARYQQRSGLGVRGSHGLLAMDLLRTAGETEC